jgi:hypothetical protein
MWASTFTDFPITVVSEIVIAVTSAILLSLYSSMCRAKRKTRIIYGNTVL